ncbi:MAG: hypothetical protein ACFFBC_14560 [Promethearchaeota archaeon]
MSSHSVDEKVYIFTCDDIETDNEDSINFHEIIIPFSEFGISQSPEYIYDGKENLEFSKRHPIYRRLLLNEFQEP